MTFRYYIILLLSISTVLFSEIDYTSVVSDIQINGLEHIPESTIEEIPFKSTVGRKIKESYLRNDIQSLYLTGYFNYISAETIPSLNSVILQFNVKENPVIQDVVIHGETHINNKRLLQSLYHQPNTVLNLNELENDKNALLTAWQKEGFDLLHITDMSYVSPNLDITVEDIIIEEIRFKGLSKVKPFIVYRNMRIKEGDPFNSRVLRKDREHLLKLGYFSDISFPKLIKGSKENSIIIEITFKEKKANKIDIGLEQEEEKFLGFFKLLKNHTLFDSDVLSGKVQIGTLSNHQLGVNSYSTTYFQPWFLNQVPLEFQLKVYSDVGEELLSTNFSDKTNTQLATREGFAFTFGKDIIRDTLTFKTGYKQEYVHPDNSSDVSPYHLNSILYDLSYSSISDFFNPKKGSYWSLSYIQGGNQAFINLNGLDYSRSNFKFACFMSPLSRLTAGFHTSFGFFNSSETVTTYEDESFVVGGSTTLRGYNEATYPFSGSRRILFNTELRYTVNQIYQLVLFYDIGNAFDTDHIDLSSLHDGKGVGIRFFTPVGPLRLDLAFGDQTYLHFGVGQLF